DLYIRVAVPVPGLDLLTYRVPDDTCAPPVGARVVVPVGSRSVTGIVAEEATNGAGLREEDIRPIRQLLDREPFVPADVVSLARWTADYYAAGAGETITAVLPPKTRGDRADAHKTRRVASLTAAGLGALESPALTSKQREALEILS